jgi:hypothetical protein
VRRWLGEDQDRANLRAARHGVEMLLERVPADGGAACASSLQAERPEPGEAMTEPTNTPPRRRVPHHRSTVGEIDLGAASDPMASLASAIVRACPLRARCSIQWQVPVSLAR